MGECSERYQTMKFYRIFPTTLIVVLGVMQVSQLQAASVNKAGHYDSLRNKYQKPTVKTCKRAVQASAQHAEKQKSIEIARRVWAKRATHTDGSRPLCQSQKTNVKSVVSIVPRAVIIVKLEQGPVFPVSNNSVDKANNP